jgi:hypothetical protein
MFATSKVVGGLLVQHDICTVIQCRHERMLSSGRSNERRMEINYPSRLIGREIEQIQDLESTWVVGRKIRGK